jgi:SAM-dependent methyltransferase
MMKSAQEIEPVLPESLKGLLKFDQREIDNPDHYSHARLNYIDRLHKMIEVITRRFPIPQGVTVADIGCCQGNLSILLAEWGYNVTAVDINPDYLKYAQYKMERGTVKWLQGNFDTLTMNDRFDCIVLGELIEHCAYPEDFIEKAFRHLKPSGILLVTTPNASMFKNSLPTFKKLFRREDRKYLEERQFGPDGDDHLFLFTLSEIKFVLPSGSRLKEKGYLGGTVLINRRTTRFLRWLPSSLAEKLERIIAVIPILNKYTCHGIFAILTPGS